MISLLLSSYQESWKLFLALVVAHRASDLIRLSLTGRTYCSFQFHSRLCVIIFTVRPIAQIIILSQVFSRCLYHVGFEYYWSLPRHMASAEPGRKAPYSDDLGWRIVWQHIGINFLFRKIAHNLDVSLHNIYQQFSLTGDVAPKQ